MERAAYEAAYQVHSRIVLGGAPKQYVKDLEKYAKEKMEYRHREQICQLYLILNARAQALSASISAAPKKLEGCRDRFRKERESSSALELGYCQQALFAGGNVALEEAVEEIKRRRGQQAVDELEARLRAKVFTPRGGLWAAAANLNYSEEELAEALISTAASWLQEFEQVADPARCFLERHGDSSETMRVELQAFYDWARPSVVGRPAANPVQDPGPIRNSLLVGVPATPFGKRLADAVKAMDFPNEPQISERGGDEAIIVRSACHANLGRLLPLWLVKSRPLYDAACQSRTTPQLFPDSAD
jgi:hypothetical protein